MKGSIEEVIGMVIIVFIIGIVAICCGVSYYKKKQYIAPATALMVAFICVPIGMILVVSGFAMLLNQMA